MITVGDVNNEQDVVLLIEQVAREVSSMRGPDAVSIQDAQRIEDVLTRLQLLLNDLERHEVEQRGISREMADRFIALERRIRAIRSELYETPRTGRKAE